MISVGINTLQRLRKYLAVLVVAALYRFFVQKKTLTAKGKVQYQEPPVAVPRGNPILYRLFGHVADFRPWECKEIGVVSLRLIKERFRWYKTVEGSNSVRVRIVNDKFLFTKDLNMLQAICGKEDSIFRNSDTIRASFGRLFPDSIAMLTGAKWKRVRRAFVSALHKLDLEVLPKSTFNTLNKGFGLMVVENVQEINLWNTFSCATFDSFMKFTYGIDFGTMENKNTEVLDIVKGLAKGCCDRMLVNWEFLWYLPFGATPRLYKLKDELKAFIAKHVGLTVDEYDRDPVEFHKKKRKNLLEALAITMRECEIEERKVSQADVTSMLVAAMFGGFDTTTSSMSFICKAFCENPEYQDKIFNEVRDLDFETTTKSDLDDLPYLNSFIKETQRVFAVAPMLVRVPNRDVVIENTLITKNTNIGLDTEAINNDPANWNGMTDLDRFRPERFMEFSPADNVFTPFGFGARKCPGYRIAHVQLQSIVAFLMKNYTVHFGSHPIETRCSLGLTVAANSSVVLKKRL